MLALRLTRFAHLIDLNGVDSLTGHDDDLTTLRIGAMTRQRALERDPQIAVAAPLLAKAAPHIGHFQIRNRGTVGGSLAHADSASELPAVALALDAQFTVSGRTVAAADFFVGTWSTAIADDELLTDIRFPIWPGEVRAAMNEVARREGDFALAGAAVQIAVADGAITRAAIALFGVDSTPMRAHEAEAALVAGADDREVAELALRDADPNDDIHATAQQRRRIGVATVQRAIAEVRP
jgi:carbon-monoxide dehydrogenase medium subunit